MSYLTVLPLDRTKHYLRLDLGFNDDDTEITSMIKAALSYIEKRTNHIMYARQKIYNGSCQVKVYDYPINSITTDPTPFYLTRELYTIYPDVKTVELNVGYGANLVPDELIQAALQMIKVWYYESEKQVNSTLIPESVKEVVEIYRRFL